MERREEIVRLTAAAFAAIIKADDAETPDIENAASQAVQDAVAAQKEIDEQEFKGYH